MLAQPTGSATSLDLVSMSDVITAIADSLRNGSYSSIGYRGIREDQEGRCPPKGKE